MLNCIQCLNQFLQPYTILEGLNSQELSGTVNCMNFYESVCHTCSTPPPRIIIGCVIESFLIPLVVTCTTCVVPALALGPKHAWREKI